MLLRSIIFIAGITCVFTLWAIAVSADDAKRAGIESGQGLSTMQDGY